MKKTILFIPLFFALNLLAQTDCDPAFAPQNLHSLYTPGVGAQLNWDVVPGSQGFLLRVQLPGGSNINKRVIGLDQDHYMVPDVVLVPGTYEWRIQVACSTTYPYALSLVSVPSTFTKPGAATCPVEVTDIDGNSYPTVEIGGQCWMGENLQVQNYQNGDPILTGLSNAAWQTATSGASSVYYNDPLYIPVFGLLYNQFAVADSRGLCPTGWHVPTDAQWTDLTNYLGGAAIAGGALKTTGTLIAGTGWWRSPNAGATNSSLFSAEPGSTRFPVGNYGIYGYAGYWWSATPQDALTSWYIALSYGDGMVYRAANDNHYGFSVRCLKD